METRERHRWAIGRYVIMPDHVHFFFRPEHEAKTLSRFVGAWKTWTSRKIQKGRPQPTAAATTPQAFWQREFFDHLLRSSESYSEKWNYIRENPVRSGLVTSADDWLTQVRSTDWNSKRPLKNMPNRLVFRPIAFPKSAPSSIQQPQNGCSRCRRLRQNVKSAVSDRG